MITYEQTVTPVRETGRVPRLLTALLMPIGPAAVALIRFVIPPEPVGPSAAANPGAVDLVQWFGLIAAFTLLPGAYAAVGLARRYRPRLAIAVALTLIPGYLGMTALGGSDSVVAAGTKLGLPPDQVTLLSNAINELPSVSVMVLIFVFGHIAGIFLLGLLTVLARLVPLVVGIGLAVSQLIHLTAVIIANPWLDLIGWGLTAVGFAFLGVRLVRDGQVSAEGR